MSTPLPGLVSRPAVPADAMTIAEIYNQGIADRTATFETRPRTPSDIDSWFDGFHPVIIVEQGGRVVAFAATSTYRPRECYRGVAEVSVYVARSVRGQGVGEAALRALINACPGAGIWKLVSRIFVENSASRRLVQKHGFREVGIYEKHAQLDGVWRDVVIVERLIEGVAADPGPAPSVDGIRG